jgi:hypothetical protein
LVTCTWISETDFRASSDISAALHFAPEVRRAVMAFSCSASRTGSKDSTEKGENNESALEITLFTG